MLQPCDACLHARLQTAPITSTHSSPMTCRYARGVEVANGRAAMIGFLVCVALEAWTGKGILSQVLWELKLVNILGPASGF